MNLKPSMRQSVKRKGLDGAGSLAELDMKLAAMELRAGWSVEFRNDEHSRHLFDYR